MESLSEGLDSISNNIIECQTEISIFCTKPVLEKVAELYAHIFLFLSGVMNWIKKKRVMRMLKSFRGTLGEKFDADIKKINDISIMVRNLAAQGSRAEVRATRLGLEGLRMDVQRVGLEGEARHRADMKYFAAAAERELQRAVNERLELKERSQRLEATRRSPFPHHLGTR